MAMKGYSTFPQAPGLVPHHQMQFRVISRTLIAEAGEVLLFNTYAVGVFYSPRERERERECESKGEMRQRENLNANFVLCFILRLTHLD